MRKGFTLLELMLVVFMVAILMQVWVFATMKAVTHGAINFDPSKTVYIAPIACYPDSVPQYVAPEIDNYMRIRIVKGNETKMVVAEVNRIVCTDSVQPHIRGTVLYVPKSSYPYVQDFLATTRMHACHHISVVSR